MEELEAELSALKIRSKINKEIIAKKKEELQNIKTQRDKLEQSTKTIFFRNSNDIMSRLHITYSSDEKHVNLRNNLYTGTTSNGKWNNLKNNELLNINSTSIKIFTIYVQILFKIYEKITTIPNLFNADFLGNDYITNDNKVLSIRSVDLRWTQLVSNCTHIDCHGSPVATPKQNVIITKTVPKRVAIPTPPTTPAEIIATYENINIGDTLIIKEEFETGASTLKRTKRVPGISCVVADKKTDTKKVFAKFGISRVQIDITEPLDAGKFSVIQAKKIGGTYYEKYLKYKNKYLQLKTKIT